MANETTGGNTMFNMNQKKKRIISAVIIAILILALVVPSILQLIGSF